MRTPSTRANSAWFAIGVLVAAILAPAATIAATSFVQIQGPSGDVAAVDMGHQLLVGPAAFVDYFDTANTGPFRGTASPSCEILVPAQSKALIVRQVQIDVATDPPDQGNFVALYSSTACSSGYIRVVHTSGPGQITVSFDPGYRIRGRSGIAAKVFGASLSVNIAVSGYRVPAAAVP
jgi:hypothetical protein